MFPSGKSVLLKNFGWSIPHKQKESIFLVEKKKIKNVLNKSSYRLEFVAELLTNWLWPFKWEIQNGGQQKLSQLEQFETYEPASAILAGNPSTSEAVRNLSFALCFTVFSWKLWRQLKQGKSLEQLTAEGTRTNKFFSLTEPSNSSLHHDRTAKVRNSVSLLIDRESASLLLQSTKEFNYESYFRLVSSRNAWKVHLTHYQ